MKTKNLTIINYNVGNHFWRKNYDGQNLKLTSRVFGEKDRAKDLAKFVKEYDADILTGQEITPGYSENLIANLKQITNELWYVSGKMRYDKDTLFTSHYNEGVNIYSRLKPSNSYTKWYSRTPDVASKEYFGFPRIFTVAEYFDGAIAIINTHLSAENPKFGAYQLKMLLEFISQMPENQLKIIVGDFNKTDNDKEMQAFIEALESLGIKRLDINEPTFKFWNISKTLDYVFYSDEIKITGEVVKVKKQDHNPVLVKTCFRLQNK